MPIVRPSRYSIVRQLLRQTQVQAHNALTGMPIKRMTNSRIVVVPTPVVSPTKEEIDRWRVRVLLLLQRQGVSIIPQRRVRSTAPHQGQGVRPDGVRRFDQAAVRRRLAWIIHEQFGLTRLTAFG